MALVGLFILIFIDSNYATRYWEGEELFQLQETQLPIFRDPFSTTLNVSSTGVDGPYFYDLITHYTRGPLNHTFHIRDCLSRPDSKCSQRPDCVFEGDCCSFYLNNSWPELLHQKQFSKCYNVVVNINDWDPDNLIYIYDDIVVISHCSIHNDIPQDWIENCEHPENVFSIENFQFVYEKLGNDLYRNKYCALCNNITEYREIEFVKHCTSDQQNYISDMNVPAHKRMRMYFETCAYFISDTVFNNSAYDYWNDTYTYLPKLRKCEVLDYTVGKIKKISVNSNFAFDFLNWLCKVADGNECRPFKNIYCYYVSDVWEEGCQCTSPRVFNGLSQNFIPSFSMFIDYKSNADAKKELIHQLCKDNGTLSSLNDIEYCLKAICSPGFGYHIAFDKCLLPSTTVQLELTFSNSNESISSEFLLAECQTIALSDCVNSHRINIVNLDYGQDVNQTHFGIITIDFLLDNINDFHSFVDRIQRKSKLHLVDIHLNANIETNVLLDTAIYVKSQNKNLNNKIITRNISFKKLIGMDIIIENTSTSWTQTSCPVEIYSIITASVNESNIIYTFSQIIDKGEMKLIGNTLFVTKCDPEIPIEDLISSWINKVVIPISCFALTATIAVYSRFEELRSLPGICTLHLASVLLLNYLIFLIFSLTGRFLLGDIICKIGAIINHWAIMSTFTWSLCLSYTSKSAFASSKLHQGNLTWSKIMKLCTFAYLPSTVFVLIFIGLDACISCFGEDNAIGYLNGNLCWLMPGNSILYGMTIPAIVLLCLTVIFYIWTLIGFYNTLKVAAVANKEQSYSKVAVLVFLKLGILLGVAWTLPAVNVWIRSANFEVFTNFLVAFQGTLIAIAFLCNNRVFRLLKSVQSGNESTKISHFSNT